MNSHHNNNHLPIPIHHSIIIPLLPPLLIRISHIIPKLLHLPNLLAHPPSRILGEILYIIDGIVEAGFDVFGDLFYVVDLIILSVLSSLLVVGRNGDKGKMGRGDTFSPVHLAASSGKSSMFCSSSWKLSSVEVVNTQSGI